jgi:hypothetical protein
MWELSLWFNWFDYPASFARTKNARGEPRPEAEAMQA